MASPKNIMDADWRDGIAAFWAGIPGAWKKAFLWGMAINVVVFFFELAQFPLGDHDVGYIDGISWLSGGRAGRWFIPFLHILSGHAQIPVFTQLLACATLVASGIGATLLWQPKAGWQTLFAGGVIISCMPAVSDFFYFHYMALAFTAGQMFMVLALHLSLNAKTRRRHCHAAAVVLGVCAMASYQSSVMTWSACFWGLLLVRLHEWDGRRATLCGLLRPLLPPLLCMAASCALYSLSLALYSLAGLSLAEYQFETLPPAAVPARLLELAQYAWLHLFMPQGYMSLWLKLLFLCAMAGGAAVLLRGQQYNRSGVRLALLLSALALFPLAAKSQFLVSASSSWYGYRFLALGVSYMYAFFLLTLLTAPKTAWRNAGLILFALALFSMAVNNLRQQVDHVRQVEHDMAVLNRVVGRIEALPGYDPDKTYHLVQLGRTRPFLRDTPGAGPHAPLQTATVSQAWNPGFELWLLSRYLRLGDRLNEEIQRRPDIMAKALEHVQGKKPFPHQSAVGIADGDTIVLYFDEAAVPLARKRLKELGTPFIPADVSPPGRTDTPSLDDSP